MQNRYAGDIGDYLKFGILRTLSRGHRLGVAWWLYPDESHNRDGGYTDYLQRPDQWRHYDPDLFDALAGIVGSGRRDVRALEAANLLSGAVFASEAIPTGQPTSQCRHTRRGWFARVKDQLADSDLVFVDPDNGLEPDRFSYGCAMAGESARLANFWNWLDQGGASSSIITIPVELADIMPRSVTGLTASARSGSVLLAPYAPSRTRSITRNLPNIKRCQTFTNILRQCKKGGVRRSGERKRAYSGCWCWSPGWFYGAHLARAGRDATFLVRRPRQEQLARIGLQVVSANGDFGVEAVTIVADDVCEPFDVILVGVKSYSLSEAMDHFGPAVGHGTMILPILNGMAHLDSLITRFSAEPVLGGMAQAGAVLDQDGRIVHVRGDELVYGEIAGGLSSRIHDLSALLSVAGLTARASESIAQDMWEKWVQMGTGAGMTCLMRGAVGEILAVPGGREAILGLFDECCAVATAAGFPPRPEFIEYDTNFFTLKGSPTKASTLRDIERGSTTEGEHILGQLISRARTLGVASPILDLAHIHVSIYENKRGSWLQT